MNQDIATIRQAIRDIPDFPKPGIIFKDITPLLGNGQLFRRTIDIFADRYQSQKVDTVLGIESRGFIIGAALAYRLGAGFCVVRKPGKLPYQTHSASYKLEYGVDKLEIHIDAIPNHARVIITDDLRHGRGNRAVSFQARSDCRRMRLCYRAFFSQGERETQASRGFFHTPIRL
jgi:adenine phosphoribosyltransferase